MPRTTVVSIHPHVRSLVTLKSDRLKERKALESKIQTLDTEISEIESVLGSTTKSLAAAVSQYSNGHANGSSKKTSNNGHANGGIKDRTTGAKAESKKHNNQGWRGASEHIHSLILKQPLTTQQIAKQVTPNFGPRIGRERIKANTYAALSHLRRKGKASLGTDSRWVGTL